MFYKFYFQTRKVLKENKLKYQLNVHELNASQKQDASGNCRLGLQF